MKTGLMRSHQNLRMSINIVFNNYKMIIWNLQVIVIKVFFYFWRTLYEHSERLHTLFTYRKKEIKNTYYVNKKFLLYVKF